MQEFLFMHFSRSLNMRFMYLVTLLALLLAVALQNTLAQEASVTKEPGVPESTSSIDPNNLVFFESYRDGNWGLYAIHSDGTNEHSIGRRLGLSGGTAFLSPDGEFIALDTGMSINLLNVAGTDLRWLVDVPYYLYDMTWLPDSKHIGFASSEKKGSDIYVLDIEARQVTLLTPNDGTYNTGPLWSPNSEKILFTSNRDGDSNLYVMDADGSNVKQITDDTDSYMSYTWSPDSETIIFSSNRDGHVNLYRMNLKTEVVVQLTFEGANYDPVFSPDGTKMVFTSTQDTNDSQGEPHLYTMDESGTSIKRLTDTTSENLNFICPMWTRDSQKIVVLGGVTNPDNTYPAPELRWGSDDYNVFIVDANGGGVKALTMDSNLDMIGYCLNLRG
jgi:TolB protein